MGSEKNIIHQENQKDSTEVKLSMAWDAWQAALKFLSKVENIMH